MLVHVLAPRQVRPDLWKAIAAGSDDAVSELENIAIQHGAEAKSDRIPKLRIVEVIRKAR